MEIASFGSGGRLVRQISERQLRAHTLLDRLLVGIIRGSAWGGLAGTALLAGALTAIVVDGAGGAGIAAGVLGVLGGIEATRGAAFALGEVLAATPRVSTFRRVTAPGAAGPPPQASVVSAVDRLEASGVSVVYPRAAATALNDASVLARRGEMIALVGANGAGKTTLVRALVGLVRVSSGAVLVDGRRLTDLPLTERLSHFGLLTQEFGRYELTVRQAVLLGLPEGVDVADDAIWRALEIAHLAALVADLPDGLDTQLGEQFGGTGLSGGQWQRLALARIAVRNAGIWILDEPTSTVDAETEREIFGELLQHRRHRITIVVSHRAWTLKGMDRIYVLDAGRIVQCGSYEELLGTPGRFRELFAEQ
ncbi:ABC transporter ATP-binding protein [Nakamurella sp. DB0629]|uniref:ABC transporter ATP-binding protein n=1 Tax=Nakamurella aerolata TaxID=1656892 RepID=A0A849A3L7_9ACTN|nr:ABC transporter ATP-binding protein [Nakamurella aerolata]